MSFNKLPASIQELAKHLPAPVTFHPAEDGGYWVESSEFPNCFATGDNYEEASRNFKFALFDYFDVPDKIQLEEGLYYQINELPDSTVEKKEVKTADLERKRDFAYT